MTYKGRVSLTLKVYRFEIQPVNQARAIRLISLLKGSAFLTKNFKRSGDPISEVLLTIKVELWGRKFNFLGE